MKKMSTVGKVALGVGIVGGLTALISTLFNKNNDPEIETDQNSEDNSTEDEE